MKKPVVLGLVIPTISLLCFLLLEDLWNYQ